MRIQGPDPWIRIHMINDHVTLSASKTSVMMVTNALMEICLYVLACRLSFWALRMIQTISKRSVCTC